MYIFIDNQVEIGYHMYKSYTYTCKSIDIRYRSYTIQYINA